MLPQNFAQKILDLEIKLEENRNLKTIQELNDLYGTGIDYYMSSQPKKARLLQKKMTTLLTRPSILEILQLDALNKKHLTENQEVGENLHRRLKTQIGKFHAAADTQIKTLIEKSQRCVKRLEKLRIKDLNKQQQQLHDRILTRVKSQDKIKKFLSCKNLKRQQQ